MNKFQNKTLQDSFFFKTWPKISRLQICWVEKLCILKLKWLVLKCVPLALNINMYRAKNITSHNTRRIDCPAVNCPGANIPGGNFPDANCPGRNCPGCELSRWEYS